MPLLTREMASILLLEDDAALNGVICLALETEGYKIRGETSPMHALENLDPVPDVLLLDLMVPGMDGPTFLTELIERGFRGRVIVISGLDEGARIAEWMTVDAFLKKPFQIEELVDTVKEVMAGVRKR